MKAARMARVKRPRDRRLALDPREVAIVDVDRQELEALLAGFLDCRGIVDVEVNVRVELRHAREVRHRVGGGGRRRRCRGAACKDDRAQGGQRESDAKFAGHALA